MMRILCLAKPVPDVDSFRYDYEKNVLVRDRGHLILNPEDATALAVALEVRKRIPDTHVETLSMAPSSARPHLEDLIRRGVDEAVLISDSCYAGSDTYVTSRILSRYLKSCSFDWIFSGTHTLDGGTAHVPPQVAEALDIPQMSNIIDVDIGSLSSRQAIVDVDTEQDVLTFSLERPAFLSFQYSTNRKLPYISYDSMNRDVATRIRTVTNRDLGFNESEVGLAGSRTKVSTIEVMKLRKKDTRFVQVDDEGIEEVCRFLEDRGFLRP